jgi:D-serine deaminase-like pyridoxal phosphate-dependent protein
VIKDIYYDTAEKMMLLKERYSSDWPGMILSVGDTPSASIVDDFGGIDEIRPGNFIFYDLMQYSIGSCKVENIAVAVACPVIAKNEKYNELVIYGGAAHLSKEFLYRSNGDRLYGYVVKLLDKGWTEPIKATYLANITQEHGIIKTSSEFMNDINRGDVLGILPVHSCLTYNLLKKCVTIEGDVIDY